MFNEIEEHKIKVKDLSDSLNVAIEDTKFYLDKYTKESKETTAQVMSVREEIIQKQ